MNICNNCREWVNFFTIQKLQMVHLNFCRKCNEGNFNFGENLILILAGEFFFYSLKILWLSVLCKIYTQNCVKIEYKTCESIMKLYVKPTNLQTNILKNFTILSVEIARDCCWFPHVCLLKCTVYFCKICFILV